MQTEFWPENLKGGDDFGDLGVDGRLIIKWILEKEIPMMRSRFFLFRTDCGSGML
jgi:hypothetical protein